MEETKQKNVKDLAAMFGAKPKGPPPVKRREVIKKDTTAPEPGKIQVSSVFGGAKQQTPAPSKPIEQPKVEAPPASKDVP